MEDLSSFYSNEVTACWQSSQPSLALGASSAWAPTLAALEGPFSPPLHCGTPFLGWPRPELAPSACKEVWRDRREREPGLRAALAGPLEFRVGVGLAGPALGGASQQAPGNEGLSTRASGCEGCTGSPSSAGPPALRLISHRALAAFPRGRAPDLQPAMPEPPTRSVGSCAAQASPTSAAPCSTAPSPIDHPRPEECGYTVREWQAAPPAAPCRIHWEKPPGLLSLVGTWRTFMSSSGIVNTPIGTLYLAQGL
ncbi:uncharacterized protein LOC134761607 [Pongo abelii]|uniref:uncharacterized protein LOC134761607 n=1 Tax=Pongo abelii TaxID=9601 RepID=UPI0030041BCD